jgi:hypothetical protein
MREDERQQIRTDSIRQKEARIVNSTALQHVFVTCCLWWLQGREDPTSFLLTEAARSDCPPSLRAVKEQSGSSLKANPGDHRRHLLRASGTLWRIGCEIIGWQRG